MTSTLTASAMLKSAAVLGRDLASKLRVSVAAATSDTDDETSLRDEAASSMAFNKYQNNLYIFGDSYESRYCSGGVGGAWCSYLNIFLVSASIFCDEGRDGWSRVECKGVIVLEAVGVTERMKALEMETYKSQVKFLC